LTTYKDLVPYDWYLALVIAGALENKLGSGPIDFVMEVWITVPKQEQLYEWSFLADWRADDVP
jgi:hypothetical protein